MSATGEGGGGTGAGRQISLVALLSRGLLALALVIPASTLLVTGCVLLLPWRALRIKGGNLYGRLIGRTVFTLAGIRPVIEHRERVRSDPPAIYVCNHTSTIDMWISMWLSPFGGCGVAKKEITYLPFFGQAYLLSGHLLLDRGNRARAIRSMERLRATVRRHGLSLWMWPEGTRSRDGRLQPMKKGFAHLAIATGLPIVPVVFHDADLRWPRGTLRPLPGDLRIEVLPPIDTTGWRAETVAEHAQTLWSCFQGALGERQRGEPPT